MKAWELFQN